jgi:anti-anti-sigma regulatory factor
MATTGHPERVPAEPGGEHAQETSAVPGTCFTQTVDLRTGCIRVSGRLDARAADMLSGTIAGLRHGGCLGVVLDLGGVQILDDLGSAALRSLEAEIADAGGRLTLLNRPDRSADR